MSRIITLLILTTLIGSDLFAQRSRRPKTPDQRFQFEVLGGINLSQLDGDFFTGFDQYGIYAGLQVDAILAPRMQVTTGMLFSQKGARIPHGAVVTAQSRNDRNIRLNYIEVPILFKGMLNNPDRGPFVEIGLGIGRLVSSQIEERDPSSFKGSVFSDLEQSFGNTDLNVIAGLGVVINPNINVLFRYSYGLKKFYTNENVVEPNPFSLLAEEVAFLRNYHISLVVAYKVF